MTKAAKSSKSRAKRGFRKLTFDEAFPVAAELAHIEEQLDSVLGHAHRKQLEEQRRALANRLSPAIRQASSRLDELLRLHAKAWILAHRGMPNIAEFIAHFKALPNTERLYSGGGKNPLTDSAIRKRLKKLGLS